MHILMLVLAAEGLSIGVAPMHVLDSMQCMLVQLPCTNSICYHPQLSMIHYFVVHLQSMS